MAIARLTEGLKNGLSTQTLLGVTGSGKTFTMASVIAELNRPTLVIAHNKTLAAQLCNELREFFPENAVEYFVSYYDYYQPEAYIPRTDTYIEKTASINDEIDRLRHSATRSLLERRDTIVVASVSCIYGLGMPDEYLKNAVFLQRGEELDRQKFLRHLVAVQYERNDIELSRGKFRARGDVLEIVPPYEDEVIRVELFGDEIERISKIDPVTGEVLRNIERIGIWPGKHFITPPERMNEACRRILDELSQRVDELNKNNRLLEAQRIESRTNYDLEMLREVGYCSGVENYSRHLSFRNAGDPPATLLDYFPKDFLLMIDESHATIPQIGGMYQGDKARKAVLIEHGFRLPSAADNRPLKINEFWERVGQKIFVSATPSDYEFKESGQVVEQIIRPTGLIDPKIFIRPTDGQIDDVLHEVKKRVALHERVLITTLTKRMAEDLSTYLQGHELKVRYLHSEIASIERLEILRDLREGEFDVLVGVNLLREGLDLPEVSLVVILDADKEGFLRSERSLIQTMGRAARHLDGTVIMYADRLTGSMERALSETDRRRKIQIEHNRVNGITPLAIRKSNRNPLLESLSDKKKGAAKLDPRSESWKDSVEKLEEAMRAAAAELDFESAAILRDRIKEIKEKSKNVEKDIELKEKASHG